MSAVSFLGTSITNGLAGVSAIRGAGLHGYLTTDLFTPAEVTAGLHIIPNSLPELYQWIGYDISRNLRASIQSHRVFKTDNDAVSWNCISKYYSAFFSCNTVLRLCDRFITYFLPEDVIHLNKRLKAFGLKAIGRGIYKVTRYGSGILLESTRHSSTHDGVWTEMGLLMSSALQDYRTRGSTSATPSEINAVADAIKVMNSPGSKRCPIQIRNDINYRQMYSTWLPESLGHKRHKDRISGWTHAAISTDDSIDEVVFLSNLCNEVHGWTIDLCKEAVRRHGTGKNKSHFIQDALNC